jgi:antitoxin MazE
MGTLMRTQVKQWGNSAVVRIPKPLLKSAGLEVDSPIEINVVDGQLVIDPVKVGEYALDDLLAGITPENVHGEVDFGKPEGREVA